MTDDQGNSAAAHDDFVSGFLSKEELKRNMSYYMVIVSGIFFTFLAFSLLSFVTKGMIQDEYDRVTRSTVNGVIDTVQDLDNALQTVGTLLLASGRYENIQKVSDNIPNLNKYQQIYWLYQSSKDGKTAWRSVGVYEKGRDGPFQAKSSALFQDILTALSNDRDKNSLAEGKSIYKTGIKVNGNSFQSSFAVIRNVNKDNTRAGLLIGVSDLQTVLAKHQQSFMAQFSNFTMIDGSTRTPIYSISSGKSGKTASEQNFELEVGNGMWEMSVGLLRQSSASFIQRIPLLVLFLGFVLTAVGALYVKAQKRRSQQMGQMNEELEQKNVALVSEAQERERIYNTLERAERDNREIIDAVSDVIFEIDSRGSFVFISAAWQRITGFDPEQFFGQELFALLHQDDQEHQRKTYEQFLKGRKEAYRSYTRLRISDGTFRAVELAMSMVRKDENNSTCVIGTITDVEERRRAERALGEAEKKYRAIVENAASGIYQMTPEGIYLSANPAMARILGYESPDELLKQVKNANESLYLDGRERATFVKNLNTKDTMHNFESRMSRKDGGVIWINENARAVRDETGSILYFEGSVYDITERKNADIALREAKFHSDIANRAKSEFLANMSHELRTPLNAIIGFSEMIKNQVFGQIEQDSYREYAEDIHKSGNGLLRIINEILDISKIDAGNRQLNESTLSIERITKSALDLLAPKVDEGDVNVSVNLDGVPEIVGEELALKQVFVNILSNAIKFTPKGGHVTVTNELDSSGQLRIAITDTGIGLNEDEIKKALSPFGQVDNDLARDNSGTGLGLTLADALMQLHGGALDLFSQKGIGTTVSLILPADRVVHKVSLSDQAHEAPAGAADPSDIEGYQNSAEQDMFAKDGD